MLVNDGIQLVKIFLAITKDEQLRRFEQRLRDPYKRWKIGDADIRARQQWDEYVEAADDMFKRTHTKLGPCALIPAEQKGYARSEVVRVATNALGSHGDWMEAQNAVLSAAELETAL